MHLSKIIKAEEQLSVESFSFAEIAESAVVGVEDAAADEPAEMPRVDPLEELDRTIQQRLLEAERHAQELESEGYEKGYAQGLKDGTEYGTKSMEVTKDHLDRLLFELQKLPEKVLNDYRSWLIATSIAISKRIVGNELATRPEMIIGLVDALVREAEEGHAITLCLHPKDLELLSRHADFKALANESEQPLTLKPDPSMERGGCRLETDIQLLDASLDARYALMEEALAGTGTDADEADAG